jgi:hypothetical protein
MSRVSPQQAPAARQGNPADPVITHQPSSSLHPSPEIGLQTPAGGADAGWPLTWHPKFIIACICIYGVLTVGLSVVTSTVTIFIALFQIILLVMMACFVYRLFAQHDRSCFGYTTYLIVILGLGSTVNIIVYGPVMGIKDAPSPTLSVLVIGASVANLIAVTVYFSAQGNYGHREAALLVTQPNLYTQPNVSGQPNVYAPPNLYTQPNAYGQPNVYAPPNLYTQPNAYGQPNVYLQPNMYGQPGPPPGEFGPMATYPGGPPGSANQNPASQYYASAQGYVAPPQYANQRYATSGFVGAPTDPSLPEDRPTTSPTSGPPGGEAELGKDGSGK